MKQQNLYLMCGVPGSGKTTWVKRQMMQANGASSRHISRDTIRFNVITDEDDYFAK